MQDLFTSLCAELDAAGATLCYEHRSAARRDHTIQAADQVRAEIGHIRNRVMQDRVFRTQRDATRDAAVRTLVEQQGLSPEQAEAMVSSYSGPRSSTPVPDPVTIQPDEAQTAKLHAAIERLKALALEPVAPAQAEAGSMHIPRAVESGVRSRPLQSSAEI